MDPHARAFLYRTEIGVVWKVQVSRVACSRNPKSAINTVVGKRQQMRWSKDGMHFMLQVRTRTLGSTLRGKFEQ